MTERDPKGLGPDGSAGDGLGRDPEEVSLAEAIELASYFVWRSGPSLYAVPGGMVEFVAQPTTPTPVPTSPALLLGVTYLRGRFVTIVDLESALGLPPADGRGEASRLVVLGAGESTFGFTVDRIVGLLEIEVDTVRMAGAGEAITLSSELASHQFDVDEGTVATLDIDRLVARLGGGVTSGAASA